MARTKKVVQRSSLGGKTARAKQGGPILANAIVQNRAPETVIYPENLSVQWLYEATVLLKSENQDITAKYNSLNEKYRQLEDKCESLEEQLDEIKEIQQETLGISNG
jgi:peptidoglycan hydrolase CwlO-like protein